MGKKLFISNLDFEVSTEELRDMFSEIGPCLSAVIAARVAGLTSQGEEWLAIDGERSANCGHQRTSCY